MFKHNINLMILSKNFSKIRNDRNTFFSAKIKFQFENKIVKNKVQISPGDLGLSEYIHFGDGMQSSHKGGRWKKERERMKIGERGEILYSGKEEMYWRNELEGGGE